MALNFDKFTEEANRFIKQLALSLGTPEDYEHAERVAVAVMHTLRERISVEESMHLVSQLPMWLKAVYVDGWDVQEPKDYDTLEALLEELRCHVPRTAGIELWQ